MNERKKTVPKKPKKAAKKKAAKPRYRKAAEPVIPEGWRVLTCEDEIAVGDAFWDCKRKAWITLTEVKAPIPQQAVNRYMVIRRVPPAARASAETPAAAIQTKMRTAMASGENVELEPRQDQIVSSGPLGPRVDAHGSSTITATAIGVGELADYIANNPIFDKRHLGYVPPGTDGLTEMLFKHHLARIPEEDRAQLYAQGGMEAVRAMAMRLARQDVRRRNRTAQAKKHKPRKS